MTAIHRVWFDSYFRFAVGGDFSADIVALPCLVTSRSHEKLSDDSRLTSKHRVKLAGVERAILVEAQFQHLKMMYPS
jgi:hypothetical protein